MFEIRLHQLDFIKNGELIGKGEIQIMNFITFGDQDFPRMEEFFNTADQSQKEGIIKDVVKRVISSRVTLPIENIKDGGSILFGDVGYNVYHANEIPEDFNWMILAIEIDSKSRQTASLINEALRPEHIDPIVGAVQTLSKVPNPALEASKVLTQQIGGLLSNILQNDKDDMVGYYLGSYNRHFHYPEGCRKNKSAVDTTSNMTVHYSFMGYENN